MAVVDIFSVGFGGYREGFLVPLIQAKERLRACGFALRFPGRNKVLTQEGDSVIFFSDWLKPYLEAGEEDRILDLLLEARNHYQKVIFFDCTDGATSIYSFVLPVVDAYLKPMLLRDRDLYRRTHYANRVY